MKNVIEIVIMLLVVAALIAAPSTISDLLGWDFIGR